MKKVNSKSEFNASLTDVYDDNKQMVKSVLIIPYQPDEAEKSLRVTDEFNSTFFYASTRLGTLSAAEDSYESDVTGNEYLAGKRYELKNAGSGKILQEGKIAIKAAEANVYEIKQTGS